MARMTPPAIMRHARMAEQLGRDLAAQVAARRRAGDEDAGRGRDQEGRDLRRETVADRQQRIRVQGGGEAEVVLEDADDDPAEQVDRDDDDPRHRVALHELRGAVHRAVEIGLAGDLGAAVARLGLGDLAGVQVGVDRHLLAGHRVEGEAGRHLGDAAGAVRDHDELDHDEDQEHDEADNEVATHHEGAERVDYAAGLAVHQHEPRHAHVDREAEQGREQEERRERRELERPRHVHRRGDDRRAPWRCSA